MPTTFYGWFGFVGAMAVTEYTGYFLRGVVNPSVEGPVSNY